MFVKSQGITIVYNSDIEEYLDNALIDYENNKYEQGFIIRGSQQSSWKKRKPFQTE